MTPPLGERAPALTASTLPPLSVWPCGSPWRVGKHKGAQTANGPSQSPSRSQETTRPVGRSSALDLRGRVMRVGWTGREVRTGERAVKECLLPSQCSSSSDPRRGTNTPQIKTGAFNFTWQICLYKGVGSTQQHQDYSFKTSDHNDLSRANTSLDLSQLHCKPR